MSLSVTPPADFSPAYNPVLVEAVSNVRDDFTTGSALEITAVTESNGYSILTFGTAHGLLQGDYILVTLAPDADYLLGVALVTEVIDVDNVLTNKIFLTGVSGNGEAFKYISNYSLLLKFYIYITTDSGTPILSATKILKPFFSGGFCNFRIDLSNLIQGYNFAGYDADDVLSSDIFPIGGTGSQPNNKSFVKYGFECFEAFDNPIGGDPVFEEEATA